MKVLFKYLGFALFMGAIGVTAWWWLRLPMMAGIGFGAPAVLVDVLLFSAFAMHHSVLARPPAKRLVSRLLPVDTVRSLYVWIASLLLVAMCWLWRPVGGEIYSASGLAAIALTAIQLSGIAISVMAVRRISVRELAGLTEPTATDVLQLGGPYRLVRHPLYLGWVLIFFGTPHMTGDRLLFAVVSTTYLVIAIPFEEAGLIAHFGDRYLEYRGAVRWRLIPYIH